MSRDSGGADPVVRPGSEAAGPATTYHGARLRYGYAIDARERYEELTSRDALARAYVTLKARGTYDPQKHGAGSTELLTAAEQLEVLAAGELLARYYRHPSQVDHAVRAGATWQQVAEATDTSPEQARQEYRSWAEGQHRLRADYQSTVLGMGDAEYAAALRQAEAPDPAPGDLPDEALPAAADWLRDVAAELEELEAGKSRTAAGREREHGTEAGQ